MESAAGDHIGSSVLKIESVVGLNALVFSMTFYTNNQFSVWHLEKLIKSNYITEVSVLSLSCPFALVLSSPYADSVSSIILG